MNVSWDDILLNVRVADLLDVLLASLVIYSVIHWLRQRAAHALGVAAVLVAVLWFLAHVLGMYLTLAAFRVGITIVIVSFLIVFQQDLRQGAERLTSWRPWGLRTAGEIPENRTAELVVEAATLLARERTGALLVLKGQQPLDRHLRGGIRADARLSVPLLHGIFNPKSQGHDGAVVIRGDRLHLFATHLPLSENLEAVGRRGTRHTAALGLAERSDALIVVVSEETGKISVAEQKTLETIDNAAALHQRLDDFCSERAATRKPKSTVWNWTQGLALKLISLLIAVGLWLSFAFEIETIQRTFADVPVEFRKLPEGLQVDQVLPARINVTVTGPKRAFDNFSGEKLTASIPMERASTGWTDVEISDRHFAFPDGIKLRFVEPPEISLLIQTVAPVAARNTEPRPQVTAP